MVHWSTKAELNILEVSTTRHDPPLSNDPLPLDPQIPKPTHAHQDIDIPEADMDMDIASVVIPGDVGSSCGTILPIHSPITVPKVSS